MDQRKQPITVEILSDGDGLSPSPLHIDKKRKVDVNDPPLLVLIDDPTPQKPTPSFVPDTPLEEYNSSIVKCTTKRSRFPSEKISGITSLICLESDNESDGGSEGYSLQRNKLTASRENLENGSFRFGIHEEGLCKDTESSLKTSLVQNMSVGIVNSDTYCESHITYGKNLAKEKGSTTVQFDRFGEKCNQTLEIAQESVLIIGGDPSCSRFSYEDDVPQKKDTTFEKSDYIQDEELDINLKKPQRNGARVRKKQSKEEIAQTNNERKLQREQDKLRKEALKADTLKMKKLLKETEKWAKGKFAIKSIVAEIDTKVVEIGSIGGHLLSRFSEKGLSFRITSNPIEGSILWKMNIPDEIVQVTAIKSQIPYILLVFEAEQFCNLVHDESLMEHIHKVQGLYPSFTVCCLTNKLMSYINKREQAQYKNPSYDRSWSRPEVEKALSKLTTHFAKVHSRQCIDEAELAEHVVGLTCSLATCQFRKKLTRLSVNANGTLVSKDFIDKGLIKKSVWLKALVAIPKVQPRFAIAIWKKYPNMRSLLNEYLDPKKSVHEKEFLLKDLMVEGLLGKENRRVGEVCSKRIYRIMMAQNGGIRTDDIEDGADFFTS